MFKKRNKMFTGIIPHDIYHIVGLPLKRTIHWC